MHIEIEPFGGIVVRWPNGLTLLCDPVGCWVALNGRVLVRLPVGIA
jgi:hypothetical protein